MSMAAQLEYPVEENSQQLAEDVRRHVETWQEREGNLIMILHGIQNQYGYVPREVAMLLAREMNISLARIYEVITFYHYFKLVPPGRHNLALCNGTACYLKGANNLLEEVEQQLGIRAGETTADREFHLETVRCIGCCGMSPAMMIDGKTHGRLRSSDIAELVKKTRTTA